MSFLETANSATVTITNSMVLKSIKLVGDSAWATFWTVESKGGNMGIQRGWGGRLMLGPLKIIGKIALQNKPDV